MSGAQPQFDPGKSLTDNLKAFGFTSEEVPESAGTGRRLIRQTTTGKEVSRMNYDNCAEWLKAGALIND
jgi:hypothetical protein